MEMRAAILIFLGLLALYLGWLIYSYFRLPRGLVTASQTSETTLRGNHISEQIEALARDQADSLAQDNDDLYRRKLDQESPVGTNELWIELRQTYYQVENLRAEIEELRDHQNYLQQQIDALSATHQMPAQYSEALLCAQNGLDAHSIAERCGISIAEAELIIGMRQLNKHN